MPNDNLYYITVSDNNVNVDFKKEYATLFLKTETVNFRPVRLKNRLFNQVTIYIVVENSSVNVTFDNSIEWQTQKPTKLEANTKHTFTISTFTNISPNIFVASWSELNLPKDMKTGDLYLDVPSGLIPGISAINKFGENPLITLNTTEDIWDGSINYTFPTTADITHLRQTVDTAADRGGTIEIQGLDSSWNLVTQTQDLDSANSTTPVVLDIPLIRVFRLKFLENVVIGNNVELRNVGGGTTYAIIQAGNNQTLMAIYTIPSGHTGYITNYYGDQIPGAAGTKDPNRVEFMLWVADRKNEYEFQIKHKKATTKDGDSSFQHDLKPYMKVTEKSDIKMSGSVSNDRDAQVHAGFDVILLDNNIFST